MKLCPTSQAQNLWTILVPVFCLFFQPLLRRLWVSTPCPGPHSPCAIVAPILHALCLGALASRLHLKPCLSYPAQTPGPMGVWCSLVRRGTLTKFPWCIGLTNSQRGILLKGSKPSNLKTGSTSWSEAGHFSNMTEANVFNKKSPPNLKGLAIWEYLKNNLAPGPLNPQWSLDPHD